MLILEIVVEKIADLNNSSIVASILSRRSRSI